MWTVKGGAGKGSRNFSTVVLGCGLGFRAGCVALQDPCVNLLSR